MLKAAIVNIIAMTAPLIQVLYLLSVGDPTGPVPRRGHPRAWLRPPADRDRGRGERQGAAGGAGADQEGDPALRDDACTARRHAGRTHGRRKDDRLPGAWLTAKGLCKEKKIQKIRYY